MMSTCGKSRRYRRLIVDTDLGLDDLVALAILRLQQCHILTHPSLPDHLTNFRICGVTVTSGISTANVRNAELLQRLLPSGTPVYVGAAVAAENVFREKPDWWNRTSRNVEQFLSSLPTTKISHSHELSDHERGGISAEEYLANNLDDPDVDILCMAPLTTLSKAIDVFSQEKPRQSILSNFFIMGGILNDSEQTKRGESTAPFGYSETASNQGLNISSPSSEDLSTEHNQFGEFNFALDIASARKVLAVIKAHIITVEACTLLPARFRGGTRSTNLRSILERRDGVEQQSDTTDEQIELTAARGNLLKLLLEFGTSETQWDSLSAAIYCNIFHSARDQKLLPIRPNELFLSDLGVCYYPQVTASEDQKTKNT
eukprot:CCRYP_006414-RA/>CCRYP_006414-RA protein AED:0.09 eAED:0.09 QI:147/1/1/1/0/0/2/719/372